MSKRILTTCYEIPGHGGASTSSYNLFRMMQNDGLNVHYMNIIRPDHEVYYKYIFGDKFGNPRELENVHNCVLDSKDLSGKAHKNIVKLINKIQPEIILGVHYIAPLLIKETFPEIPLIYYASGCMQMQELLRKRKISNFLSFYEAIKESNNVPEIVNNYEKIVIEKSILILTHSEIIKTLYKYFYNSHVSKIYDDVIWKFEWIYNDGMSYSNLAKPFEERDIDILFISTDWNRIEKNKALLLELLGKLENYNVTIIGEIEKNYSYVSYRNIISDRKELFNTLGNSKCLVSVSSYDPAPGILYEASAMECNIVASKNCGNWQICNYDLLVNNYNAFEFLEKIKLSLTKKYNDNKDYFIKTDSYRNLNDILEVLPIL